MSKYSEQLERNYGTVGNMKDKTIQKLKQDLAKIRGRMKNTNQKGEMMDLYQEEDQLKMLLKQLKGG